MNRRSLLRWICRAIASVSAAVVAVPAVRFLLHPLLRRQKNDAIVRRLAPLDDLPVGKPQSFPILGTRQDAWTTYEEEVLGRVWIVRRSNSETSPEQAQVEAFTAICPHLGCAIDWDKAHDHFLCPCHRAVFDSNGQPAADADLGYKNPTPRGMDALECRVVQDAETETWWVEVEFQRFEFGLTTQQALT
ncbi:MAG: Rieske (2Fe-2S) protein [Planctomycetales bacterium]|nr:Rieske (2Fe-2S) protein [Planctomycetales bacterium]